MGASPQSPGTLHQEAIFVMTQQPSYSPLIPNNTSLSSNLKTLFIVLIIRDPHLVASVIYQLIMNHSIVTTVTLMQTTLLIRCLKMAAARMSSLALRETSQHQRSSATRYSSSSEVRHRLTQQDLTIQTTIKQLFGCAMIRQN